MSGFEIAGVVLGGFPILIEAAKPLSRYLQGAERWWHFKRDFMTLISTIEDESIAYSQNLELLLTPVDIDPEAKASLQEDAGSKLWHHPEIQAKLKSRIKPQYMSWFLRQLLEMTQILDELFSMLPIDNNGGVDFPRTTTVDYELFRLKQSFSTRRQHLLDNIVRINESLYKFLAKDSHIKAEAARSATTWYVTPRSRAVERRATILRQLQSEARKLSSALLERWNCCCIHQCGVGHDWKSSQAASKKPSLNLLLEKGTLMKQTRVEVKTEENLESSEVASSCITMLDQMANLRMQTHQELAPTEFEKSARRPGIASSAIVATSTLVTPAVSSDLRFWGRPEQKKLTKANPSPPQLSPQSAGSSKSTKKSVSFSHPSSTTSSTSSSRSQNLIRDTCLFLNSSPSWTYHQCLKAEEDAVIFSLEPLDQQSSAKLQVEDLEAFYGSTPRLPNRLQIGLELALTILGLGMSCWIPRGWDRREVFVLNGPNTSTKPFLRHESLSFTLRETIDDTRVHTEASLFSLGVVLLELIYQETLEQQPFWNKYCDNGEPNEWTHQCTAMEWQSKVEARYGDDLSEPIRLCVEGGFSKDANLDNPDFLREVLETVVSPLERFLTGWRRC